MALKRKQFPPGYKPGDFKYMGRPAKDQGDFGEDVGIADGACVNQFGEANNAKYYHAGVVQSTDGKWWMYTEWGSLRRGASKSWQDGEFCGNDFMFVECAGEADARKKFKSKVRSKNLARLEQKVVAGVTVWAAKVDKKGKVKDAYLIQDLATRVRGLPDAYTIKDSTGVTVTAAASKPEKKKAATTTKTYQPQVVSLVNDLVGGTIDYARAASAATGIVPTKATIERVRDELIPAAGQIIAVIGDDVNRQITDARLIDLSKLVGAIVPRPPPPVSASQEERAKASILSSANILALQADLDAYEAALDNEDFGSMPQSSGVDCDRVMNARLRWIDPNSDEGKWLEATFWGMSNNRHGNGRHRIKNMFAIERPDRDIKFVEAVKAVANRRASHRYGRNERARLQPRRRIDLSDIGDYAEQANVFLGFHGTRAVNVAPILQSNLRLPKQLKGVHISGAAFGHGVYAATDWRKSYGYTGYGNAHYGSGGGIRSRGWFMFMQDIIMGKPYLTPSTGRWSSSPGDSDSIAAYPEYTSVVNDEHIFFDPNHQRIRYMIEGEQTSRW